MRRLLSVWAPVSLFIGFMLGTAGVAVSSVVEAWSGPFVCRGQYGHMVRTSATSNYTPTSSTTIISTYCADAARHLKPVDTWKVVGVITLEAFVVIMAVGLIVTGFSSLRRVKRRAASFSMS